MKLSPVFIAFIKMIFCNLCWQKELFKFLLFYWYCCAYVFWLCAISTIQNLKWSFLGFFVSFSCSSNFFALLLFQVAWIWHQLQGSELLGKSFQASMKNCFKIYRTCLIHLGIWQNIVTSLTAKTYSPLLFPCFLSSKKTLHSFMKVKAEVYHLLLAKEK